MRTAEDIFFLQTPELRTAISAREAGRATPELASVAHQRRELRDARKRLHPPVVPQGYKLRFGPFDMSAFETQRRNVLEGTTLRGFAVSPRPDECRCQRHPFSGRLLPDGARHVRCARPRRRPGRRSSRRPTAVTDVGGVLAHGSIVAREYGIPAVLGTGSASRRIRHGQRITVDGDQGLVVLEGRRAMTEAALATSIRTRVVAASLRREAGQTLRAPRELAKEPGLEGNRFPDGVLAHARVQGFAPNDRRITTGKRNAGPATSRQTITRTREPPHDTSHLRGWLPVRPGLGVSRLTVGWLQTRRGRLQNR